MSEAMTTVEIEDVLSSIRRLVSEDLRPTHKLVSAALQKGGSKLILTPALRIVSDVRSALPERLDPLDDPRDLQTVLLDIEAEAKADATLAEGMPVFGSVRSLDSLALNLAGNTGPEPLALGANFLTTAMSRINGLSDVAANVQGQSDTIEAVVAAVGAAVGPDEWEPDGGEPAPQDKAWADTVWNSDASADPDADDVGISASLDADAGQDVPERADLVEIVGHDVQEDTKLVHTGMDQEALVGADSIVFHDASAAAPEPAVQALADDMDDGAGFVTEDLLREIVRDMIRDELQGTLGERITRNVRKLVRAEINRAMASRDFDDIAHRG